MKIEFILENVAQAESKAFSLPMQSVSMGGGTGIGGGSGGSGGSSSSKASTVGPASQMIMLVMSCLLGRALLLEIIMAAVMILNITLGKHSSFVEYH